jgi:hypothetical protein
VSLSFKINKNGARFSAAVSFLTPPLIFLNYRLGFFVLLSLGGAYHCKLVVNAYFTSLELHEALLTLVAISH